MPSKKKIGEILVESGAASEDDVRHALGQQRAFGAGKRLGEVMVALKMITPTALARALATQYDLPFVELPEIPARVSALVPVDYQAEYRLIPFRLEVEGRSERLHLAVQDPAQLEVVDELRFQLRKSVRVYVAASDDIDNTLAVLRGEKEEILEPLALDESESGEMQLDRGNEMVLIGSWFHSGSPDAQKVAALDWDLPSPTDGAPGASPPSAAPSAAPPPSTAPAPAPSPSPDVTAAAPLPPAPPPPAVPPSRSARADLEELLGGALPDVPAKPGAAPRTPTPPGVQLVTFAPAPRPASGAPPPVAIDAPPAPPPSSPAEVASPAAGVAVAAALAPPAPAPTGATRVELNISEQDLKILDDLERMAQGGEPALDTEKVKPARMVASLIRLLIRKGVIHELEFLEELGRK